MEDTLKITAIAFNKILNKNYNIILGYKGKSVNLNISFNSVQFKHLAGLHKLKDKNIATDDARVVFRRILNNEIRLNDISNSTYFSDIENRFMDLKNLEQYFDDCINIFGWSQSQAARNRIATLIKADYLIKENSIHIPNKNAFIFLAKNKFDKKNNTLYMSPFEFIETVPSSFFNSEKDYTTMQKQYTLLYKEKIDLSTNNKEILFQHPRFSLDK